MYNKYLNQTQKMILILNQQLNYMKMANNYNKNDYLNDKILYI